MKNNPISILYDHELNCWSFVWKQYVGNLGDIEARYFIPSLWKAVYNWNCAIFTEAGEQHDGKYNDVIKPPSLSWILCCIFFFSTLAVYIHCFY